MELEYSHKAAHHLFGVFWTSGVCKADEGAVDGDPGAPLQLKHTHFYFILKENKSGSLMVSLVLKVNSCPSSFYLKGEFTVNLLNGTTGIDQDLPFMSISEG